MTYFKDEQEVYETYKKSGRKLVIFEGTVYDVSSYIPEHPGGADKIEEHLGKSIDEPFEEAEHTKAARLIFRDLEKVGVIKGAEDNDETPLPVTATGVDGYSLQSRFKFDYSRGIFCQLYDAKMTFDEYV